MCVRTWALCACVTWCVSASAEVLEVRGERELVRSGERVATLDAGCAPFGYSVGPRHVGGGRDVVVVQGRTCFYLWNENAERLSGPFAPAFEGEGSDSQSGMLVSLEWMDGGQVLVGGQVDAGPFAYGLRHVGSPERLEAWASWGDAALFALPIEDHPGSWTLVVARGMWEVEARVVARGVRVSKESVRQEGPRVTLEQEVGGEARERVFELSER